MRQVLVSPLCSTTPVNSRHSAALFSLFMYNSWFQTLCNVDENTRQKTSGWIMFTHCLACGPFRLVSMNSCSHVIHCAHCGTAITISGNRWPFATSVLQNSERASSSGHFLLLQLSADQAWRQRKAALATVWWQRTGRQWVQKQSPQL